MKYGQTIQDLAARGQNWRFYDENVRFLRQTQERLVPWCSIHGELWLRSQYPINKRPPVSIAVILNRELPPSPCDFKHTCFKSVRVIFVALQENRF